MTSSSLRSVLLAVGAVFACGCGAQLQAVGPAQAAPADPAAPADAWTPSDEEEAVYRALSVRDPEPTCEQVEALTATPVATLETIVERATMPPWAGMRAATCLVSRHAEEAEATITAWMQADNTKGLVILVSRKLDDLPLELALRVGRAALAGPNAEAARERIAKAENAEIRALAE